MNFYEMVGIEASSQSQTVEYEGNSITYTDNQYDWGHEIIGEISGSDGSGVIQTYQSNDGTFYGWMDIYNSNGDIEEINGVGVNFQ